MKTAIRMTVAAIVMALIGAVGGQGLRASAAAPAWWVETIDGIDIVQVCRVGELQVSTDYPNSTANTFRVTLQNVSNETFGGTLQFGIDPDPKEWVHDPPEGHPQSGHVAHRGDHRPWPGRRRGLEVGPGDLPQWRHECRGLGRGTTPRARERLGL